MVLNLKLGQVVKNWTHLQFFCRWGGKRQGQRYNYFSKIFLKIAKLSYFYGAKLKTWTSCKEWDPLPTVFLYVEWQTSGAAPWSFL